MPVIAMIVTILLLIPAAVAGISYGLIEILQQLERVSAALDHAGALLTELTPLGISLAWLAVGIIALVLAAWLLVSHFGSPGLAGRR